MNDRTIQYLTDDLFLASGTGGVPEKGELAGQESHVELAAAVDKADLVSRRVLQDMECPV